MEGNVEILTSDNVPTSPGENVEGNSKMNIETVFSVLYRANFNFYHRIW